LNVINEPETTKTIIQPSQGWKIVDLKDINTIARTDIFYDRRDLKVRYKQTVLGVAWAIIQPVMTMVVFSIFFGGLARVPSDGIPYPLFSLAGLFHGSSLKIR
jgi:lipopolysaccharide transport system permease protein